MSELYDEVREALAELAAKEVYQKMKDPEYLKIIIELANDIAQAAAQAEIAEDDDLDDSDIEEMSQLVSAEIEKMFTTDEQLREFSAQTAKNKYVTKNEAKAYLDGYLAALGPKNEIEPEQLSKLKIAHKEFLSKCQKSYDFIDELLSALIGITKREGIEKAISIERRNSVIKAIIPTPEEYIEIHSNSWQAAQEFFDNIQKALFTEPETQAIGKTMFDAIKNAVSSISEDLLKVEAEYIYK